MSEPIGSEQFTQEDSGVFPSSLIVTAEEVEEFKKNSVRFEYQDAYGIIKGYRKPNGDLLVTEVLIYDI